MRSHEAGALHGQSGDRGPAWLRTPEDSNELVPHLWAANVSKVDGVLTVAGESVTDLAATFGTPTYVVDEDDFRRRARAFKEAFPDADVYYAGKAFLCVATARWIAEEGLNLDVCTGGELAVAIRAEFPRRAHRPSRQQQVGRRAAPRPRGRRRPHHHRLGRGDRATECA